ncbi:hypothetical protein C8R46DRAFT_1178018 [Mycena filopes]|nr:hypothetical protein C8R46DRAFT_1178018 [Mycena filopes]
MTRKRSSPTPRKALASSGSPQRRRRKRSLAVSSETISKNAEKLSKNAGQLWSSAKTTLGPAAEKAEAVVGSARKSLFYNFAVARELAKQVYRAELQFPKDAGAFRTAYETLYQRAIDPAYWRGIMQSGEIARVGIYAVEAYGIFKIGEIIGRRKVVGYPVH